jgi:Domain of unknown function (DUF5658)
MNKKYYIYFFIAFEIMQIMDLILTQRGLLLSGNRELNPLYSNPLFMPFKLIMPLVITIILYSYNNEQNKVINLKLYLHEQHTIKIGMFIMILMYSGILINNLYRLN